MKHTRGLLLWFGAVLLFAGAPAAAQSPGVTTGQTPFRYDFPNAYFDYGGVALPRAVPGGYKGVGTLNAEGLFVNGIGLASMAFQPANGVAVTGGAIDGTVVGGNTPAAINGTVGKFSGGVISSPTAFAANMTSGSKIVLGANGNATLPPGRGKLMVTDTQHGLLCEFYYGNGNVSLAGGTTTPYCATTAQANGSQKIALYFSVNQTFVFQTTWTDAADTFYIKNDVIGVGIQ